MNFFNQDLGVEWTLLELSCLDSREIKENDVFDNINIFDKVDFHWGELLEQAIRHKILSMLVVYVLQTKLFDRMPRLLKEHLRATLELNKYKNSVFYREAAKIIKSLAEKDVQFVFTKGITLESTIYRGNGSRSFVDIDLMILPKHRNVVIQAISNLGYSPSRFDWKTLTLKKLSPEDLAIFKLNPDHLPSHLLLINDPVVPYIDIDFATSLTWTRSPFNVPIEDALAEIVYQPIPGIPDVQMPCFNSKFQFIFTILHLFREAWVFREGWVDTINAGWETDVTLSKFADVIRLWRAYEKELNTPEFIQLLEKYQIIDPILWVLEHTDRTFHTGIVPALGLEGRVTEEWLHSAGGAGGKRVQWKGTMRERLHCKNRRQLFLTDT